MGILWMDGIFGISTVDVSTGDYFVTEVSSPRKVIDEITKFSPSEIVCNPAFLISGVDTEDLQNRLNIAVTTLKDRLYDATVNNKLLLSHFHVSNL